VVKGEKWALIARGYPAKPKASDLLIQLFKEVLEEYPECREYLPEIKEETVREVIANLHMRVKTQNVVALVMGRYNLIK
jgi:uncharacterized Fe-S cluster-containing protein